MAAQKEHQIVFVNIGEEKIPSDIDTVAQLAIEGATAKAIEGWTVLSHTVNQQLDGRVVLSLFCERDRPQKMRVIN